MSDEIERLRAHIINAQVQASFWADSTDPVRAYCGKQMLRLLEPAVPFGGEKVPRLIKEASRLVEAAASKLDLLPAPDFAAAVTATGFGPVPDVVVVTYTPYDGRDDGGRMTE